LKTRQKYIDVETADFAFAKASGGSQKDIDFLKVTLKGNLKLIDPAWAVYTNIQRMLIGSSAL